MVVQEKIDGVRALWFDGQLWTREGVPIEGAGHIIVELRALEQAARQPMFFDGEFQVDGTMVATTRHFRARGRRGDAGQLFLFDALPLAEWRTDSCELPLTLRLGRLAALVRTVPVSGVSLLPWSLCGCPATLLAHAAQVWARGGEGSVGKAVGSLYRRRRSTEWLKVKTPLT